MVALKADAQLGMDETVINNPELEQALEEHQKARESASAYRSLATVAKKRVVALIEGLTLAEPTDEKVPVVARIGLFRITKKFVKGRAVSFSTEDRVQLSFGLADAPEDQDEPADDEAAADSQAISRLQAEESRPKPRLLD